RSTRGTLARAADAHLAIEAPVAASTAILEIAVCRPAGAYHTYDTDLRHRVVPDWRAQRVVLGVRDECGANLCGRGAGVGLEVQRGGTAHSSGCRAGSRGVPVAALRDGRRVEARSRCQDVDRGRSIGAVGPEAIVDALLQHGSTVRGPTSASPRVSVRVGQAAHGDDFLVVGGRGPI